jgi:membrane-associated phospholipid phosphatase
MPPAIVVCALAFSLWGGAAALTILFAPRLHLAAGTTGLRRRLVAAVDAAAGQVGRVPVAAFVAFAAEAVAVVLFWALGRVAKMLEPLVDVPSFQWFEHRQVPGWTRIWRVLTNIGSPNVTQLLVVVGAIGLAVLWRRRRWWVPGACLVLGYLMEKYGQIVLQTMVHRGHPPTTLGTWPSGGMARVLVVYGLIAYFLLRAVATAGARARAVGAAAVAFCATVQGYSRTYNLEHWLTDVIGGFLFGLFLLSSLTAVAWILDRDVPTSTAMPDLPDVAVRYAPSSFPG